MVLGLSLALVGTAPTGGDITLDVYWVYEDGGEWLIDQLTIVAGERISYSLTNVPDGRRMPYHVDYPLTGTRYDWPPSRLVKRTDSSMTTVFRPDGEVEFEITGVGTGGGSTIIVTVQS